MTNSNTAKFGLPFPIGLVCLFAAVIFSLAHSGTCHLSPNIRPSRHIGTRFVFADLDGDRIPDLAQVESQNPRSANANYSIHVKLSAGVESAIGVSGPIGGLRVAARDVNGDDNLDLVVTSNLDSSFIEVFLNDGHGNFAAAPSANFATLENVSDVLLETPSGPQRDRVTLASTRTSLDEALTKNSYVHDPVYSSGSGTHRENQPVLQRHGLPHLGRSPPMSATFS
ncbi:MAG: VCBS repeat-containing protein [Candidatus Acidiferrum sp.]